MNKEADIDIKYLFVIGVVVFMFFVVDISFVLADHVVNKTGGGVNFTIDENVSSLFNITINITGAGDASNVTEVNITLWNFTFTAATNGTGVQALFSNTSNVLTWRNTTLLINGSNQTEWFVFNATATTPGVFNITITTLNATGSFQTNITVTVNDTIEPSWTSINNFTRPSNISFEQNISANDSGVGIQAYWLNDTSYFNISSAGVITNVTNLSRVEIHWLNVSVNDSSGNENSSIIFINLTGEDSESPNITLIAPSNSVSATTASYNFTFNVSDINDVDNCSLIIDGGVINILTSVSRTDVNGMYNDSFSVADHTWSINCSDASGNVSNSAQRSFTVTSDDSGSTGGTTGGTTTSYWSMTYLASATDLISNGYVKELSIKRRIKIIISNTTTNSTHYVGLINLTNTTATINVSSTPQQAIFNVGNSKKFDVTENSYYDLEVTLNSINNSKANITIRSIREVVPSTTPTTNNSSTTIDPVTIPDPEPGTAGASEENEEKSPVWMWIFIVVLIIGLMVGVIIYWIKNKDFF
jgi:hypothetical protein